jgi:hypothetical protein
MDLSSGRRLFFFLGLVILSYGAVWIVFSLLQNAFASLLASAIQVLATLYAYPVQFWTSGTQIFFGIGRGRRFEAFLDSRPLVSNLPLLLTLVLMTPGLIWSRRIRYLLGAGGLLFATHLCFLLVKVQVVLISAQHPSAGSPVIWNTLDDAFEIFGKSFFPVFIWVLFTFRYMLGHIDRPRVPGAAGSASRNAPCPCGSGIKYKKCCGETSGNRGTVSRP